MRLPLPICNLAKGDLATVATRLSLNVKEIFAMEGCLLPGSYSCLLLTWRCQENVPFLTVPASRADHQLPFIPSVLLNFFFSLKIKANLLTKKSGIILPIATFHCFHFVFFHYVFLYNEHTAQIILDILSLWYWKFSSPWCKLFFNKSRFFKR